MKKLTKILCLLMALCMMLCFTACDEDDDDKGSKSIAGTYQFYEMTQDGETIDAEAMEETLEMYAEYMGEDMTMEEFCSLKLNKDGTGTLVLMGEEMEMEYDDEYIWPVDEADEKVEYTFKNGKLTMAQDGAELIFKK